MSFKSLNSFVSLSLLYYVSFPLCLFVKNTVWKVKLIFKIPGVLDEQIHWAPIRITEKWIQITKNNNIQMKLD